MDRDEDRVKGSYVDRSLKSLEVQVTPTARTTRRSLAAHVKVNRDCGFHFYRLPIQKKWLVSPLLDRLDRGGRQQRGPPKKLQGFKVSVFSNKPRQDHQNLKSGPLFPGRVKWP